MAPKKISLPTLGNVQPDKKDLKDAIQVFVLVQKRRLERGESPQKIIEALDLQIDVCKRQFPGVSLGALFEGKAEVCLQAGLPLEAAEVYVQLLQERTGKAAAELGIPAVSAKSPPCNLYLELSVLGELDGGKKRLELERALNLIWDAASRASNCFHAHAFNLHVQAGTPPPGENPAEWRVKKSIEAIAYADKAMRVAYPYDPFVLGAANRAVQVMQLNLRSIERAGGAAGLEAEIEKAGLTVSAAEKLAEGLYARYDSIRNQSQKTGG